MHFVFDFWGVIARCIQGTSRTFWASCGVFWAPILLSNLEFFVARKRRPKGSPQVVSLGQFWAERRIKLGFGDPEIGGNVFLDSGFLPVGEVWTPSLVGFQSTYPH